MGAVFNDPALFQHNQAVEMGNRRETVRNRNDGFARHHIGHSFLHSGF